MSDPASPAAPDQGMGAEFAFHEQSRNDVRSIFQFEDYPLNRILLTRPPMIVDIGAHCGAFSYLCASRYPQARIRAFEPLKINYDLAVQNTQSFANIEVRRCGLSNYDGTADLFYSPAFGFAASSTVKTHDHTDDFENVDIRRAFSELSDLAYITILKIDTEGHEYHILDDMAALLENVTVIFLEIHSNSARRRIDALLGDAFVLFYMRCDMTNRYKAAYVSRRALEAGEIRVATAPELRP